nr:hypothetical protein [uncultured Tyzzerella sp.]
MEKIILIGEEKVKLKATASILLRYKALTGKDLLKEFIRMEESRKLDLKQDNLNDLYNSMDLEFIYNLFYVLAKTADPTLPPMLEFMDRFDYIPLEEISKEVIDLVINSMGVGEKKNIIPQAKV